MNCMRLLTLLALVSPMAVVAALPAQTVPPTTVPAPVVEAPLLGKVVVIGSELSLGAGWAAEVGATVSLADVVEQGVLAPHQAVVQHLDTLAGRDVLADLERQARLTKEHKPTLVVALDSLALVTYDAGEAAPERFDRALRALKGIGAPLVLGDLPDWRTLATRSERSWLQASKLPSVAMQANLTARLTAFAADTKDVVLAPVARLWSHLERDEPLRLRGNLWGRAWLPDLAGADRQMLRLDGGIALWLLAADALVTQRRDVPAAALVWDARELRRRVYESRAKERAAQAQLELDQQRGPQRPPPPPPPSPEELRRLKREKQERDGSGGRE